MNAPRASFVNVAVMCCHAHDWSAIEAGFRGLPEAQALDLAREITRRLEQHAVASGDWTTWAKALHVLPRPGQREAAQWFVSRLDAWTPPPPPRPVDDRRRRLARLAVRLVKSRMPSVQVIAKLNEANATLPEPLDGDTVYSIALWAASAAGVKNAA